MGTSNDKVALTVEEQQLLAALEHRAGSDDPKLHGALTAGSRTARLCSRRTRDIAAVLLFVAGATLMFATFVVWPLVGAAGAVIQTVALCAVLSRWGPLAAARAQQGYNRRRHPADPSGRPVR